MVLFFSPEANERPPYVVLSKRCFSPCLQPDLKHEGGVVSTVLIFLKGCERS